MAKTAVWAMFGEVPGSSHVTRGVGVSCGVGCRHVGIVCWVDGFHEAATPMAHAITTSLGIIVAVNIFGTQVHAMFPSNLRLRDSSNIDMCWGNT